jgi:OHCU decarboxylase
MTANDSHHPDAGLIFSREEFIARFGEVFEHSPWIAERAARATPFVGASDIHSAMMAVVRTASRDEQIGLIRAHPELAGREAGEGTLTAASGSEQGRLGFTSLTREEFLRMQDINRRYREKFGFPCIVALRLHSDRASVMQEMESAVSRTREEEIDRALGQIGEITRGRIEKLLEGA